MSRRVIVAVTFLLMLTSRSWAAPLCGTATLADYVALGSSGCAIGDKTFNDFSYAGSSSGGATAIPASGVTVTPQVVSGEIGLEFSAAWGVGAGQTLTSTMGYTVTAAPGNVIVDAELSIPGLIGSSNDGELSISEHLSNGTTLSFGTATFVGAPNLTASTTISVSGGSAGTASVGAVTNLFSQAPLIPTGGACSANSQCRSGLCSGGSCVPPNTVPAVSSRNTVFFAGTLLLVGLWSVRRLARRQ